jgi:hypothetical protein
MNPQKSTLRELRSQFLRESKKFCKVLEYNAKEINGELKDQILDEMRQNLKSLLALINQ